jgi:hypothetical protein
LIAFTWHRNSTPTGTRVTTRKSRIVGPGNGSGSPSDSGKTPASGSVGRHAASYRTISEPPLSAGGSKWSRIRPAFVPSPVRRGCSSACTSRGADGRLRGAAGPGPLVVALISTTVPAPTRFRAWRTQLCSVPVRSPVIVAGDDFGKIVVGAVSKAGLHCTRKSVTSDPPLFRGGLNENRSCAPSAAGSRIWMETLRGGPGRSTPGTGTSTETGFPVPKEFRAATMHS